MMFTVVKRRNLNRLASGRMVYLVFKLVVILGVINSFTSALQEFILIQIVT